MSQQGLAITTISSGGTDLPTKSLSQVTFAFPAGTTETDITDLTFTALSNDIDASLDMTNVAQINTIRVYEEVDTTNIKQIKEWEWPTDNDTVNDEVLKVSLIGHGTDIKVTIQSAVDEGGINIPIAIAEYVY